MRIFVAALAVVALAGCGQRPEAVSPGAPAANVLRSAPIDAALVTPDFGWVLTENQLLVSSDGGFTESKVELPAGQARAAHFTDAQHGWVAAVSGPKAVTVARTSDGGNTWQYAKIATSEPIGSLSVGFGTEVAGGLLARIQTSNAFSRGYFFATADGGQSWNAAGEAPVAGQITVEPDGRIWLAGGVMPDHLYTSKDQGHSWTAPSLDVTPTVVGLPKGGVLPVSVGDGTTARVALLTTADSGATWHESANVALQADQGVPAALAVNGSVVLLADNGSGRLHRGGKSASSMKSVDAKGLPGGVSRMTLAGPNAGWALASNGSCAKGKQSCAIIYTLAATDDSGDSWRELLTWQEKMG